MKVIRTKSIPNVDSDRLRDSLAQTHQMAHTPDGIREHMGPRRDLINHGVRGLRIAAELTRRNEPTGIPDCRFCSGSFPVPKSLDNGLRV